MVLFIPYPPQFTSPDPAAIALPQSTGSPILASCLLFKFTVPEPDAVDPPWGGDGDGEP
jgi:hypothetical protein